jgi:hypothetical protein
MRNRSILLLCALTLGAHSLLAAAPSARTHARMVYDTRANRMILFGGTTRFDAGTKKTYDLADTWEFDGVKWQQRYTATTPPGRGGQAMVWDSNHLRVIMFGGHHGNATQLNDTWVYDRNDWQQIQTPQSPPARFLMGSAYDPLRDRLVIFGGNVETLNVANGAVTTTFLYDTWEFDGTTWRQTSATGPTVNSPALVYDPVRKQMLLLGIDTSAASVMYSYDAAAGSWSQIKPEKLPTCANDASLTFQTHNNTVLLTGSACAGSSFTDEVWEWDGTNWTLVDTPTESDRVSGAALAYDLQRQQAVRQGGTLVADEAVSTTSIYRAGDWVIFNDVSSPSPRSLFALATDPVNKVVYLFGGLNENDTVSDFWRYQNGQWQLLLGEDGKLLEGQPAVCSFPVAAYDTDRQKIVLVCSQSETFEFDGKTFKSFELKTKPPNHRWASMVYDQTLKKTVFFGGWDNNVYSDQTWTWDGSAWTRVKKNPAPSRSLATMWWDPTLKKTVLYGGIGRLSSLDRLRRYSDMWTFDGTQWTELKNVSTPGPRYGAQAVVDPRTGHVILFGGLRVDGIEPNLVQVYADDTWEWDGAKWTRLETAGTPPARENGGLAYDPSRNQLFLFGGYVGYYLSDFWTFDPAGKRWRFDDPLSLPRRRAR